ncbi:MAG TPA: GTP-binding protein [Pararobbsia sp.]|nr:GTP-binding protein [Pararobbsia sp.]
MSLSYDVLPVTLITGFLGSGKSTLLSDMLHGEAAHDTAILVNEFGEVGLDHLLIGAIDTQTVLLDNGCVCCSIRGELKDALASLFSRRARGEVPAFMRVVIETTGLATPAPIMATVLADPLVRCHYRLDATVTVVDAACAAGQHERYPEWLAQVTAADQIVISKTDLVDEAALAGVGAALAAVNPAATQWVRHGRTRLRVWPDHTGDDEGLPLIDALLRPVSTIDVIERLGRGAVNRFALHGAAQIDRSPDAEPAVRDGSRPCVPKLIAEGPAGDTRAVHATAETTRTDGARFGLMHRTGVPEASGNVGAFAIEIAAPLDWSVFTLWFTLLLNRHGDKILRVKGLLSIAGSDRPAVIHAVQHLVHPVLHLDAWPEGAGALSRRSRIVFITDGLERETVEASYARCVMHLEQDRL